MRFNQKSERESKIASAFAKMGEGGGFFDCGGSQTPTSAISPNFVPHRP